MSVWCRGLVGLLLVVAGAAIEMHYDLPSSEVADDVAYENYNDIYTGPVSVENMMSPRSHQDALRYKILKMLQMDAERSSNRISEEEDGPEDYRDNLRVGATHKRRSGFISRPGRLGFRPLFRSGDTSSEKTKKEGKPGSNQVCYFKLCAFVPPSTS